MTRSLDGRHRNGFDCEIHSGMNFMDFDFTLISIFERVKISRKGRQKIKWTRKCKEPLNSSGSNVCFLLPESDQFHIQPPLEECLHRDYGPERERP